MIWVVLINIHAFFMVANLRSIRALIIPSLLNDNNNAAIIHSQMEHSSSHIFSHSTCPVVFHSADHANDSLEWIPCGHHHQLFFQKLNRFRLEPFFRIIYHCDYFDCSCNVSRKNEHVACSDRRFIYLLDLIDNWLRRWASNQRRNKTRLHWKCKYTKINQWRWSDRCWHR